ncbi:ABC transporter permease [Oceanidesulfovibrio marinus]|uniref:ABC transporter n=1 Tax=Oceanidesulfovibrio marinus TaxID=370038 RepID=A0A6P1ZJD1_9BACT|nr:ABC transporter permease subunit [Oceanidesulfovibrio marinus]TVM33299.1 ABC transporter [Oceanidesulfovibrio marinus]
MKRPLLLALLAVLFLAPLAVLAVYSLGSGWAFPDLLPRRFDLRAVRYIAGEWQSVAKHLASSTAYSLATAALTLVLTIAPAHLFARRRFPGKVLLEGILLAPALVPAMTFSMGVHYMFIRAGLNDTMLGVVLVLATFSYPYMLRALVAGYQSFGEEYALCAQNLGAGPLSRLWRVELPLLMPAIVAGGSVVFLVAFSEYFLVFLIGGGRVPSFTGYLFPFLASSDLGLASALTLVFFIAPLILFVLVELTVSRAYRRRGLY